MSHQREEKLALSEFIEMYESHTYLWKIKSTDKFQKDVASPEAFAGDAALGFVLSSQCDLTRPNLAVVSP